MLQEISDWFDEWEEVITVCGCVVVYAWLTVVAGLIVIALFKYVFF